jgi:hypothetical protein
MKNIFEELSKKEINYFNTKEYAEKIKLFSDFYNNYRSSIKENAKNIERNLENLVELEKETKISFVEQIKINIDEKIYAFYKKLDNEFKYSYSQLENIAQTNDLQKIIEKRKETDIIAENYRIFSDFIPQIKQIEKYNKNYSARKELKKQFNELKNIYYETKWNDSNIKYLKKIYRKNFWLIFPNNIIRKMKKTRFFEGKISAENLKNEMKIFIKEKLYEKKYFEIKNYVQEPQKAFIGCEKQNNIPRKYFKLNNILSCKTSETNWNERFENAMKIFSTPSSDDEKNYLKNLAFSLQKNIENGYLSRLYNLNKTNSATIFLQNINCNN